MNQHRHAINRKIDVHILRSSTDMGLVDLKYYIQNIISCKFIKPRKSVKRLDHKISIPIYIYILYQTTHKCDKCKYTHAN